VDVVFPDFYLTPMEKYVKRPDGFSVKERILYVSVEDSPLIDDSIVSYAPPVAPAPEVAATEQNPDDKAFEQISLFDEEGGDEKK
jgi:hypothetical protein